MNFGEYLRMKRKERNYRTNKFSAMLGISPGYLSSLETGKRSSPSFELLEKMADILDLNIRERHTLYDLAAEFKKPSVLADDLNSYIYQNPNLRSLLRLSMEQKLSETDWDNISAYVKNHYFI